MVYLRDMDETSGERLMNEVRRTRTIFLPQVITQLSSFYFRWGDEAMYTEGDRSGDYTGDNPAHSSY